MPKSITPYPSKFTHESVLLTPTIAALLNQPSSNLEQGVFVDATFGRGGHSQALLARLPATAKLVVFDKDPQAIATANQLAKIDKRVTVVHDSFANISTQLTNLGVTQVVGIMADLGVSSPQLDDASRGFSFMADGLVDMRMNNSQGITAGEWLQTVDETTLANVLYNYGEERYSRRIARAIKQMDSYHSTLALADTIKQAHPKWEKNKHPATKSFQAIRIFINNELGDVDALLEQSITLLQPEGVLAVISFHSLEDRRVKQFMQRHSKGQYPEDANLPMPPVRPKYFGKPQRISATSQEIANNPRARSAWLRVVERTNKAFITA